ncbi:cupin domain-containing protein [Afifella pfennigii]|uniref:cupin domain-containing protein n=1 Tax=Afifella pfennigii TaxID=209897 RepID=UPI00055265FE|nr:cupin domain-containing protein [Afifella pfennigii]
MSETRNRSTKTEGAAKAGKGRYHFAMKELDIVPAGTGYSTSRGGVVEGERMLVGYIRKPQGTGSRPHSHPNEQFNYVMSGTLRVEIDGQTFEAPAGTLVYVPANVEHSMVALPGEDVMFLAIKDLSHGIIGKATDGTMSGPRYMEGFKPQEA